MSTFKTAVQRIMSNTGEPAETQSDVVQGKRVLVVDNIDVNWIVLIKVLSSLANGQKVVEKFEASQSGVHDLILMEKNLPI